MSEKNIPESVSPVVALGLLAGGAAVAISCALGVNAVFEHNDAQAHTTTTHENLGNDPVLASVCNNVTGCETLGTKIEHVEVTHTTQHPYDQAQDEAAANKGKWAGGIGTAGVLDILAFGVAARNRRRFIVSAN